MATAQGGTQTCGERTCTPFDPLSHSGTPRPEWRIWQATAGFLARGSSPAPPSRANDPVVFGAGFPLTVAGAAPVSLQTREPPRVLRARYSLLVRSEDKTPSARGLNQTETPASQPSAQTSGMLPRGCSCDPVAAQGTMPQEAMRD